jgi:DNA-binding XRE family transcriptional regulator
MGGFPQSPRSGARYAMEAAGRPVRALSCEADMQIRDGILRASGPSDDRPVVIIVTLQANGASDDVAGMLARLAQTVADGLELYPRYALSAPTMGDAPTSRAGAPADFASTLRRLRRAAHLSQEELAERAGVSAKAIGALERGARRKPYRATVDALCGGLGLSAEDRSSLEAARTVA